MTKLAVFGGTFDPVHHGHLEPAVAALATFAFDEVVFVPAGKPPHKLAEPRTPFAHRFAMLALATQDHQRFTVSDIELERDGPTYTVDTLLLLRERRPGAALYFLLGSDSFAQIATWHRWEELADLATLVVLHRPSIWGEPMLASVPPPLHRRLRTVAAGSRPPVESRRVVYLLDHPPHPASATAIRDRLRRGETVTGLVPPAVHRYIVKHGLYHEDQDARDGR